MGYDLDMKLEGVDRVSMALNGAQRTLKGDTVPVMQAAAERIARGAEARATQHPSGLWRWGTKRLASPRYNPKKVGEYWFRVETPGTNAGRAEAISEFARLPVTGQGAAMIRALDSAYGRGGGGGNGRILWATADDIADSIIDEIQAATDVAAKHIEKNMGSV